MSELIVLPIGVLVGILVSAPVGPANIICIERAVRYGFFPAFVAGVGASLGDGILAAIAASGFEAAEEFVLRNSETVRVLGGIALIAFGVLVIRSHPHIRREPVNQTQPVLRGALASFAVTVTNPGALIAFAAFFSGMAGEELMHDMSRTATVLLVLSVMGGALLWWLAVAALVTRLRDKFSDEALHRINVVSGSILAGLGVFVLGSTFLP